MKKDSSHINRMRKQGWTSMEQMLNEEMPQDKKKERKYGIWFTYSIAASLILIFTVTYISYYLMMESSNKSSYVFYQGKKIEPISDDQYGYSFSYEELKSANLSSKSSSKSRKKEEKNEQLSQQYDSTMQYGLLQEKSKNNLQEGKTFAFSEKQNRTFKGITQKQIGVIKKAKEINQEQKQPRQSLVQSNRYKKEESNAQQTIRFTEENSPETILKNKMASNEKKQKIQFISPVDMRQALLDNKVDLGLKTNGSIGFVSKGFDNYGIRFGLEFSKNLNSSLSLNSGVRYSAYKESYQSTYRLGEEANYTNYQLITDLSNRKVNRRFVEFPVYADYSLTDVIKFKVGGLLTYNKNNSSNANHSALSIANNNYITDDVKLQAGKLMQDKHGYLGEAVLGTTIDLDKVSLDVEGNYGLISNQAIDNRSILGVRLNYKFGR